MISEKKIKVGVLRGGQSNEYNQSLRTGEHVLSLLREMPEKFEPVDILISKEGDWHIGGLRKTPHKAVLNLDLVFNALHGAYGEDGQVQRFLEDLKIPHTGSSPKASHTSFDKDLTKEKYKQYNLLTPKHELLTENNFNDDTLIYIFRNYMHPVIVKPASSGSSVGIHLAKSFQELKLAVKETFNHSPKVLVEEYVKGKDATCAVLEKARGEKLYAFMPSGNLSSNENKLVEEAARKAHEVLELRHYSSSDFIVTPKSRVYILETDSQPVLSKGSVVVSSFEDTGWSSKDFVEHLINLALDK